MLFTKATEIYFRKLFESQTGQTLCDTDGIENRSFAELQASLEQKHIHCGLNVHLWDSS